MTKREKLKQALRGIAKQMLDLQERYPEEDIAYTRYIMDGITERTEKMFLNELVPKLEEEIRIDKRLDIPSETHEAMLKIVHARLEVLNS